MKFQTCVVHTKLDIYVLLIINNNLLEVVVVARCKSKLTYRLVVVMIDIRKPISVLPFYLHDFFFVYLFSCAADLILKISLILCMYTRE